MLLLGEPAAGIDPRKRKHSGIFQELHINISSLVVLAAPQEQAELIIRAAVVDVSPRAKRLSEKGSQVLHVVHIG